MNMLLCSLLLLPLAQPFATLAVPVDDVTRVDCSTCGGDGMSEQACWLCDGERKSPCPGCSSLEITRESRWAPAWSPQAVLAAELEAEALEDDTLELKPGEFRCPAECAKGKLNLNNGTVDCKVCKLGTFRCIHCKEGRVDCAICDATGRMTRACSDCAGTGKIPDPAELTTEQCPLCLGSSTLECGTCSEPERTLHQTCLHCLGQTWAACKACSGTLRIPCRECGSRGKFGLQEEKCETCKRKGFFPCDYCNDGVAPCDECEGQGTVSEVCADCGGAGEHACHGCGHEGYLAWERTAEQFLALGDFESAKTWILAAIERCEARYDHATELFDEEEWLLDAKVYRKLTEQERRDEIKRLNVRRKAIERAAKDAR